MTSSTSSSTSTTPTTSTSSTTIPTGDTCVDLQARIQGDIGDGSQFRNRGQLVKRVTALIRDEGGVAGACRACIVRQFAREIPIAEQLPCVQSGSVARGQRSVADDQPLSAVKLLLKSSTTAEKALFLSKDAAIYPPLANTSTDPTLFGATLEFCSAQGAAVFDLPAHHWHMNGSGSVFKFTRPGAEREVKAALIKGGRTLKIVSKSVGLPLPGGIGPVGVRVTTGEVRNCALFDVDTILRDEPGRYVAQSALAGAIPDCADASLGCVPAP